MEEEHTVITEEHTMLVRSDRSTACLAAIFWDANIKTLWGSLSGGNVSSAK